MAAIVAEGHCHLMLEMNTGDVQTNEAEAEPLESRREPTDGESKMEGMYLWPQ